LRRRFFCFDEEGACEKRRFKVCRQSGQRWMGFRCEQPRATRRWLLLATVTLQTLEWIYDDLRSFGEGKDNRLNIHRRFRLLSDMR
jgi:hypothetical protein